VISQTAQKEPVQRRPKQAHRHALLVVKSGRPQANAATVRLHPTWLQRDTCCAKGLHTPGADERYLTGIEAVKTGLEEDHCRDE